MGWKHQAVWEEVAGPLETSCWIWRGELDRLGYGRRGGVVVYREMWVALNGPVPDGLELDYLCRETSCVNPSHLEPVPHSVNIQRGRGAKINQDIAEEIRAARGSLREIAARYGLHHTTVLAIRRGRPGRRQAWT